MDRAVASVASTVSDWPAPPLAVIVFVCWGGPLLLPPHATVRTPLASNARDQRRLVIRHLTSWEERPRLYPLKGNVATLGALSHRPLVLPTGAPGVDTGDVSRKCRRDSPAG